MQAQSYLQVGKEIEETREDAVYELENEKWVMMAPFKCNGTHY